MGKILATRQKEELSTGNDVSPWWALAVGLIYVFGTRPGARVMRELERAVRKYAADPAALWRLVRDGDDVIDVEPRAERLDGGRREIDAGTRES